MQEPHRQARGFSLAPGACSPLRILLVEDSPADADLLTDMLHDELPEAVVSVSSTVTDALPLLAHDVDIAITDLSLPDAQDLQALTAIMTARPDIAVVVMTGRQDRELALAALTEGAEDYLVKGSLDARAVATAVLHAAHRRSVERETHRYERLALSLLDAMEAPTCAVDLAGDIIAVNRAWRDVTRVRGGDAGRSGVGRNYFEICRVAAATGEPAAVQVADALSRLLAGELDRFEFDYPCSTPQEERWFSLRMNPLPETAGAVLSHVDISAAKRAEQALSHQSLHDALTGLPNRILLGDRITQALAWAARADRQVALAFVDLDQFKRINDSLGHAAGDDLLVAVAQRLQTGLRDGDTLARFAGDEFVAVWPGVQSAADAEALAARLAQAFDEPFVLERATVVVTASLGVAVGRSDRTADELLLEADAAMYAAKGHGRGQRRMFTSELRAGAESRLRLEGDLREAIVKRQFVLHYQPVVDIARNAVAGVEALVRWEHPDGLRMPDTFIPVAEASGLVVPLGAWVLEEACRQNAAWAADGLVLDVAVNLSVRQLAHPAVTATINDVLARTGLDPGQLMVEITESAVMEDADAALAALSSIASLGSGIAIDDFGTGYSSLVYLKRYPIHALKVDRSFVSGMGRNGDDDAIVASIVDLARAVGAVCIAEGVETTAHLAALRALDCQFAQGYLFARPVPAALLPAALVDCERVLHAAAPVAARGVRRTEQVEAAVVERIQQLDRAGSSATTIAAVLNQDGTRSPKGVRWHSASVRQVLAGRYVLAPEDDAVPDEAAGSR